MTDKIFKIKAVFLIVFFCFYFGNNLFAQISSSLEKELNQFNEEVYKALEILNTQPENVAIPKVAVIKKELMVKAEALRPRLEALPDMTEEEEKAYLQKQMEKPVFKNLMALLSNEEFTRKITEHPKLQKEFDDLMELMDIGFAEDEAAPRAGSPVCSFSIGSTSPISGTYLVTATEEEAFAYDDVENDQFVIEINGDNFISVMLIIEKAVTGKHPFSMEMQVAIDISANGGEDYFTIDNYQENGGGYIQINRMDKVGGKVEGIFSGLFNDGSTDEDTPVKVEGSFSVKRVGNNF